MCLTCGCGDETGTRIEGELLAPAAVHAHPHPDPEVVVVEERLLARNDDLAGHVRASLAARGVVAVNLMSSPGSGKTSLLERTIRELGEARQVCVVEGDQETTYDADRIRAAGARAVQVNTGAGCHLDAGMVHRALHPLDPDPGALLFVENVGNLVCPALFDLGERARAVVVSVTEGDDKPEKYPHMLSSADVVVVNKTDLLPYVDFDLSRFADRCRRLRPGVLLLPLSVRTGDGMDAWYGWLDDLDTSTPREGARDGLAVGP